MTIFAQRESPAEGGFSDNAGCNATEGQSDCRDSNEALSAEYDVLSKAGSDDCENAKANPRQQTTTEAIMQESKQESKQGSTLERKRVQDNKKSLIRDQAFFVKPKPII